MKHTLSRFWYKFKNCYFRKEPGPGETLIFLCGSEEELRRLTIMMCHVCPDLWEELSHSYSLGYISLQFIAPFGWSKSFAYPQLDGFTQLPEEVQRHIKSWGHLIARHNHFMGTEWIRSRKYAMPASSRYPDRYANCTRISEQPIKLAIKVHPPSAHERAEALLSLSEWLDGKVSEQEKRELLRLPEDIEV